jgi:hypothetical protein
MPNTDRGQSELFGYLLIFSVVVLTISLVGTTGFMGLNNAQDFQRTTNAEYGFTALANNVDDVVRRGAPSRETAFALADASLSLERTTTITVTVDNGTPENRTVELYSIVYDSGSGTTISYSSGALVRQDGPNSVMFRQPNFVLTNDTVILPIIATTPTGDESVGGTTDVAVETRSAGTDVLSEESDANVTIEVTSPHAEAWQRYLETETAANCSDVATDTVTCDIQTQRVYVAIQHIDVRFQ